MFSVTIIQSSLYWHDKKSNLKMFEQKISSIQDQTDLIILPEMFTTGFTMNAESNAENTDKCSTLETMKLWAKEKNAAICGSIIVKSDSQFFNRLYFVMPDGNYAFYDKRHLFRMAGEDKSYTSGSDKIIIHYKGWKIRPLICYDLRFPVWSRNVNNEYDLLIYVANWPSPRKTAWQTLLKARAAENLAYCVGVNRVGEDENKFHYSGNSSIIDFRGDVIFENENDEVIYTAKLSKEELTTFREKFPAHLDADVFEIKK